VTGKDDFNWTGLIVGCIAGLAVLIIVIVVVAIACYQQKRRANKSDYNVMVDNQSVTSSNGNLNKYGHGSNGDIQLSGV
jgi:hypothetical protein